MNVCGVGNPSGIICCRAKRAAASATAIRGSLVLHLSGTIISNTTKLNTLKEYNFYEDLAIMI